MAQAPATRRRTAAAPARSRLMTAGIGLLGVALGLGGWLLARQQRDARAGDVGTGEHVPVDLALDKPHPGAGDRAPEAFRPDPTAPVPAGERDALRPATGPAPSLVQDRGSMRSQTGSSNA
ncbi:hypothetical protein [Sphingomonas desiccabilis]|nr:hypothetical protein [Sphingomonas desiccabilis]MBB3909523.1 hypothetical protein [Sphingomonas desiccabilis]